VISAGTRLVGAGVIGVRIIARGAVGRQRLLDPGNPVHGKVRRLAAERPPWVAGPRAADESRRLKMEL